MPSKYTTNAYKDLIYTHPDWKKTAQNYEIHFAKNLYDSPMVKQSAHDVLVKLSSMLNAYYGLKENKPVNPVENNQTTEQQVDDLNALQGIAATVTGEKPLPTRILQEGLMLEREDRTSAGQIGFQRKKTNAMPGETGMEEAVDSAEKENETLLGDTINENGTVREQMSLLYNGLFRNGGRKKAQIANSRSLKNMMLNITPDDVTKMRRIGELADNEHLKNLNIDFDVLNEQEARKTKDDIFDTTRVAVDLKKAVDKKKGRGNFMTRFFAGIGRYFSAHFTWGNRQKKSKQEQIGLGEEYYNNLGLPLSEREARFGIREEKDEQGNVTSRKLLWKEGQAYNKMKKPVDADGMLAIAGASGTTLRMLGAYRMMGAKKTDLLYFRLALMAWMVTSQDHSISEILKGSHNAGVKGYEDMSEAASMYQTIDPLTPEEIRENYAPDRKYPHETIYLKMMEELAQARKQSAQESKKAHAKSVLKKTGIDLMALDQKRKVYGRVKDEIAKNKQLIIRRRFETQFRVSGYNEATASDEEKENHKNDLKELESIENELDAHSKTIANFDKMIGGIEETLKLHKFEYKDFDETKFNLYSPDALARFVKNSSERSVMTSSDLNAQDVALNVYSTEAFDTMNKSEKYGRFIGNRALTDKKILSGNNYLKTNSTYYGTRMNEVKNAQLLERISDMIRLSYRVAQDALLERGQVSEEAYSALLDKRQRTDRDLRVDREKKSAHHSYNRSVFRGEWFGKNLNGNSNGEYETTKLTSTTANPVIAMDYREKLIRDSKGSMENTCITEYKLNGKSGVMIASVSNASSEAEVLLPIGTKFEIRHRAAYARFNAKESRFMYEENMTPEQLNDEENSDWKIRVKLVQMEEVSGPQTALRGGTEKQRQKRDAYRRQLLERQNEFRRIS